MRFNIKIEKYSEEKKRLSRSSLWTYLISLERFGRDDSNHILKNHKK